MMEMAPSPTDLMSENSDYQDVDHRGVMLVEDSEDEQENIPPLVLVHQNTPHPVSLVQSLIPIEDPAPITPVVDIRIKGIYFSVAFFNLVVRKSRKKEKVPTYISYVISWTGKGLEKCQITEEEQRKVVIKKK
jgi:hypothetical protein